MPDTDLLTINEACAYLKVTRATLYRWARSGRLPLRKVGLRTTRVSLGDLQHLSEAREDFALRAWAHLSESTFAKDWDNEDDAIYDNWREIYGVPER
jgi:excisionase family DNA binding protein